MSENRGLLFGKANLGALGIEQKLGARSKSMSADIQYDILARLVLTQLCADPRQKHVKAKRLNNVVVCARLQSQNGIRSQYRARSE